MFGDRQVSRRASGGRCNAMASMNGTPRHMGIQVPVNGERVRVAARCEQRPGGLAAPHVQNGTVAGTGAKGDRWLGCGYERDGAHHMYKKQAQPRPPWAGGKGKGVQVAVACGARGSGGRLMSYVLLLCPSYCVRAGMLRTEHVEYVVGQCECEAVSRSVQCVQRVGRGNDRLPCVSPDVQSAHERTATRQRVAALHSCWWRLLVACLLALEDSCSPAPAPWPWCHN